MSQIREHSEVFDIVYPTKQIEIKGTRGHPASATWNLGHEISKAFHLGSIYGIVSIKNQNCCVVVRENRARTMMGKWNNEIPGVSLTPVILILKWRNFLYEFVRAIIAFRR